MNGLIIWIVIIAISSILRNLGNKKKQEQRTQKQHSSTYIENDEPEYKTKDRDLIKRVFQEVENEKYQNVEKYEKPDSYLDKETNIEDSIDKIKSENNTNNIIPNKDITNVNLKRKNKSIKDVEIQDIKITKKSNIKIKISKSNIVNGIVMSEILGKPKCRS